MDSKNIKSILQDVLENKIPAAQIDLLPTVQSRLVTGTKSKQQGERMTQVRIKRLAYSLFAVIAILAISLTTPQGRAFAQNVLQFFRRTENKTFELKPSQIVPVETVQADATAVPPSSLISVTEAEALVGFDVLELPSVPAGLNYLGARLYGNSVSIEYEARGMGGNLFITQSRDGYWQSELDWDKVPSDAIVPVKIGNVEGEFVKGTFVVHPNDTVATWNPDAAMLRLRWVKDGIWFEMAKFGNVESIEYLDQDGLIELAESLQ